MENRRKTRGKNGKIGRGRTHGRRSTRNLRTEEEILEYLEKTESQPEEENEDHNASGAVIETVVIKAEYPIDPTTEILQSEATGCLNPAVTIKDEIQSSSSSLRPTTPTHKLVLVNEHEVDASNDTENSTQCESIRQSADVLNSSAENNPVSGSDSNKDPVPVVINIADDDLPPAKQRKLDPLGRGRVMDAAWNEFCKLDGLEKTKVQCIHCGTAVSSKVERLQAHLKKCMKARGTIESSETFSDSPLALVPSEPRSLSKPQTKGPVNVEIRRKQPKMFSFIDMLSPEQKRRLDIDVGHYIYASNLPFSHVESRAFLKFSSKLKPRYKPPSRRQIGSTILNDVDAEVLLKLKHELRGKSVTMIQDGWKANSTGPIIAHCITTGDKAYFLNAVSTGEHEKTAEFCATLLLSSIDEVEAKFDVDVFALVTDNCNAMNRMREIICTVKPQIFTYGCHAHLLNLVGKKLTSEDLQERVEKVHKFFRNHDSAAALLKNLKGTRPILASTTRWNSWIECFESNLKNQTKYLEVSRTAEAKMSVAHEILEILNDGKMYSKVEETVAYLKPIQAALDSLQGETAILADGIEKWIQLRQQLTFTSFENREYFEAQFEAAVTDVGIAAHMLHPKFRGTGLDPDLLEKGNQFLSRTSGYLVIVAAQLELQNSTYFPTSLFSSRLLDSCSPVEWWKSQERMCKLTPDVIDYAVKLLSLPAGPADIERHFSVLGNIMNERRSRLGLEKAEKLCRIYKALAGDNPPADDGNDWDLVN